MPPELRSLLDSYMGIFTEGLTRPERYGSADHPRDTERWHRFVIACHGSETEVTGDTVHDTLMVSGWPESNAWARADQFRREQALLRLYDQRE